MKKSLILTIVAIVVAVLIIAGVVVLLLPPAPVAPQYTIRMREYSFVLDEGEFPLEIVAGETVRIRLINEGSVVHQFMVVEDKDAMLMMVHDKTNELTTDGLAGEELIEAYEEWYDSMMMMPGMITMHDLELGEDRVIELRIDEPGTYWIVCLKIEGTIEDPEFPVHIDREMFEQIVVVSG